MFTNQFASHSHSGFLLSEKSQRKKPALLNLILAMIRTLSGSYNFVISFFLSDTPGRGRPNSDEPTSKSIRKTVKHTSKGKAKQEPVSDSGSEIEV